MIPYPILPNETERLHLLHALDLLDTPAEPIFDRITRLVAKILKVPIALVSLVDTDRQWFKSQVGLEVNETPRDIAFCAHAIAQTEPMIVQDTLEDVRFKDNPLVTENPNIRFYAGVPLRTSKGLAIGTLCAVDTIPRFLSAEEIGVLVDLADLASKEVQLRESTVFFHEHIAHSIQAREAVEARFQTVFERAGVGIALVAPGGGWLRVNDALCQIVGYSKDELTKLTFQDITHPDDLNTDLYLLRQLIDNEIDRYQLEKRYIQKNGKTIWIHLIVTKQMSPQGELEYFVSIIKDIQERKEAEASLAELRKDLEDRVETRTRDLRLANTMLSSSMEQQLRSEHALRKREAELRMVIENANDAYVCIDQTGVITDWNRQAEQTFGWSMQEAIGKRLDEMIIPAKMREAHRSGIKQYLNTGEHHVLNKRIELIAVRRNGETLPVEVRICALAIDGKTIFSAFLHDITERKKAEDIRVHEATHDALTGLSNRRALFDLLPQAISRANRNQAPLALLFLDLDGFKQINDTQGHEAGDVVLLEVASRLHKCVRQTDTVVRLGGDEFTVVLEGLRQTPDDAQEVAYKILAAIQNPIALGTITANISASIGVAIHNPNDINTADQLVNAADSAMYEAKRTGKSKVCIQ